MAAKHVHYVAWDVEREISWTLYDQLRAVLRARMATREGSLVMCTVVVQTFIETLLTGSGDD